MQIQITIDPHLLNRRRLGLQHSAEAPTDRRGLATQAYQTIDDPQPDPV